MFPFYYNSETKESKFYKEYDFQVEYVYSSIEIIGKTFSKASYDAGENVSLEIALYNSGMPRTSSCRRSFGRVIEGLPLQILRGLKGYSTVMVSWDSSGYPPSNYEVYMEIRDDEGRILERDWGYFDIGTSWCKITDFSVDPKTFRPGENLSVSLTASNISSVSISGRVSIKIKEDEKYVAEIEDLSFRSAKTTRLDGWMKRVAS